MNNKQRQEIIDYLEQGDKFTELLIRELERVDITNGEKRTYSSLLDAILVSTELYCYMTEWPDNVELFIPKKRERVEEESAIIVEHGPKTLEKTLQLKNYVEKLPLSYQEKKGFVNLMQEQLTIAEHEQYLDGFCNCMRTVQAGGFKGLEDKLNSMVRR